MEIIVWIIFGVIATILVTLFAHFALALSWLAAFITALIFVVVGVWVANEIG